MKMPTKKIKIGDRLIGENQPVFVVAEAGVNYNGRLDLTLKMVDAAKEAGADAIKFQTFRAEQIVVPQTKMAPYQKKNIGKTKSQLEMLKELELKEEFYKPIIKHCKKRNIIFLSTPHGGFESVDFLESLKVPAFKFGSGDLTNLPLLQYAAKFGKPMILGTGMATMEEVKEAIKTIKKTGNNKIVVLHCTTNYPCPPEEVNLRAMQTMMKELNVLVGYSDHTLGIQVPIMAATLGACIIEKHFTLDKNMPGPDHKASVEPGELKEMVKAVRDAEKILGNDIKKPTSKELIMRKTARKSIVANEDIPKGVRITKRMLAIKRPGTGLKPKYFYKILGRKTKQDISKDSLIKLRDLR